ncbi:MAG: hypothetical protein IPL72_03665 [Sulfuritalea sp.]|nr:hypothetical protein [Sulfuritalea sp.]
MTETATVTVTVTPADDATTIGGDTSAVGAEDTALTGTLTASDSDGLLDGTVFGVSSPAAHGTATIDPATGAWDHPGGRLARRRQLHRHRHRRRRQRHHQVISLTVNAVRTSPTTASAPRKTARSPSASWPTTASKARPRSAAVARRPRQRRHQPRRHPGRYHLDANCHGTDSFSYTVTSPAGITETATVTVTVTPANDATPPTATNCRTGWRVMPRLPAQPCTSTARARRWRWIRSN